MEIDKMSDKYDNLTDRQYRKLYIIAGFGEIRSQNYFENVLTVG